MAQCFAAVRELCSDTQFTSRQQVASSLTLQILLYFNIYFSVIWAGLFFLLFQWKIVAWDVPIHVIIISPIMFCGWLVIEPFRLALGYLGNLDEKVGWLGPFMVVTLVPQFVVHIYFFFGQTLVGWITLEIETALSGTFMGLYLLEIIVAWHTTKRFVKKAAADFPLHAETSDRDLSI